MNEITRRQIATIARSIREEDQTPWQSLIEVLCLLGTGCLIGEIIGAWDRLLG